MQHDCACSFVLVCACVRTCMCVALLSIKSAGLQKREPMPEVFHLLFGPTEGAFRFEELYCRALLMLDAEWHRTNATYMQFPLVLR